MHKNNQINQNYQDINEKVLKLNIDPETQKKLRVMKYVHNQKNINLDEKKMEELHKKIEKDNRFYQTLNQACKIKELKKVEMISKAVSESQKSSLNISLVSGQPHFLNFIISNDAPDIELLQISVSKSNESNLLKMKLIFEKFLLFRRCQHFHFENSFQKIEKRKIQFELKTVCFKITA